VFFVASYHVILPVSSNLTQFSVSLATRLSATSALSNCAGFSYTCLYNHHASLFLSFISHHSDINSSLTVSGVTSQSSICLNRSGFSLAILTFLASTQNCACAILSVNHTSDFCFFSGYGSGSHSCFALVFAIDCSISFITIAFFLASAFVSILSLVSCIIFFHSTTICLPAFTPFLTGILSTFS
jgi:hypothetical protein